MAQGTAMEMYDLIEYYKPQHLTVGDVNRMNKGDSFDVIIWDRNFEEYGIWDNLEKNKIYNPKEFFKNNYAKITYLGNLVWDITFDWGTYDHPIHIDVSSLGTQWTWIPIENSCLLHDCAEIQQGEIPPMRWTDFPDNTRVGWRGPIMLQDKLKDYPEVYYVQPR